MSIPDEPDAANYDYPYDDDWYDETDECWECSGEGGWNSCMEGCCPMIGGEEGCTDKHCWRTCPNCKGTGSLP